MGKRKVLMTVLLIIMSVGIGNVLATVGEFYSLELGDPDCFYEFAPEDHGEDYWLHLDSTSPFVFDCPVFFEYPISFGTDEDIILKGGSLSLRNSAGTSGVDMSSSGSDLSIGEYMGSEFASFSGSTVEIGGVVSLKKRSAADVSITFDATPAGVLTWDSSEDYFVLSDDTLMNTTEKLYFRDTDISINSASDGHLSLTADTSVDIGDGGTTDYASFSDTGSLTLEGDARVYKTLWIPASNMNIHRFNTSVLQSASGGPGYCLTWAFPSDSQASSSMVITIPVPDNIDTSVQPELLVAWCADDPAEGDCYWEVDYRWIAPSQSLINTAQETALYQAATSIDDYGLIVTDFQLTNLSSGDQFVFVALTRRSDLTAYDTLAAPYEAHMCAIGLRYVSDKLGEELD